MKINIRVASNIFLGVFLLTTFLMPNTLINGVAKLLCIMVLFFEIYVCRYDIKIGFYTIWACILSIYSFSSIFWAYNIFDSIMGWQALFKNLLLGMSLFAIIKSKNRLRNIMQIFVLAGVSLVFALLFINGFDFISYTTRLGTNVEGYNANDIALKLTLAVLFAYLLLKETRNKVYLISILIMMPAIVFSGSRKGLFLLFTVLIFSSVYTSNNIKQLGIKILRWFIVLVIIFWGLFEIEPLYNIIGYRLEGLFNYFMGSELYDASTRERMEMIEIGRALMYEKFVFGYGINNYTYLSGKGTYAHNNYFEIGTGMGIVGIIVWYIQYIGVFKNAFIEKKYKQSDIVQNVLLGILLAFIIMDYGLVSYLQEYFYVIVSMIFAYLEASSGKENNKV